MAERYDGFIIGHMYEGTVRVNVTADQDYVSLVEFPLSFTVEEASDIFDGSDLIVDRAETVVDEPLRRFVTTIEGRWPGPEVGHFVAFSPPVWSAAVAFPDPEDGGAFEIVYEQPMRPDDYRRDYSLQGTLWAVNGDPENPASVRTLDLLQDIDLSHLRYDTCGCASGSVAAWPLAALAAAFVRRRRARRSRKQ